MSRPPDLSPDELRRILAAGPQEQVAFMPANAPPARLAEVLVALANAHGGLVLMGVTPTGKAAGIEDTEEARAAARGSCRRPDCSPRRR